MHDHGRNRAIDDADLEDDRRLIRAERRVIDKRTGQSKKALLGASSRKNSLAAIKSLYAALDEMSPGTVPVDPTVGVTCPRVSVKRPDFLDASDCKTSSTLPVRRATASPPRDRIQAWMLTYTAMRSSEMRDLLWTDVDFAANVLYLRGKGDKTRIVDIHPELLPNCYRNSCGGASHRRKRRTPRNCTRSSTRTRRPCC